MDERIAEEGHASNDDPRADECERYRGQRATNKSALLEGKLERFNQPGHGA